MKYFLFCFSLLFASCGLDNSYYLSRNYEHGQMLTSTIGEAMVETKIAFINNVYHNIKESASYELIYSGKSGNIIKIVYREFYNDLARPAFSQELQYDLSESKTIKFKETVIEIYEASNQEISFRVINSKWGNTKQGEIPKQLIRG